VFQPYSAYTPFLDEANADLLRSESAPERILWFTPSPDTLSIDGRDEWFDAPSAKIEMLCRYLPLATSPTWQILGRVTDRCRPPIPVGTVTAMAGEEIPVPTDLPPGILTMRVNGIASDLLSRITTLAYKAPPWWLHRGDSAKRMTLGTSGEATPIGATADVGYRDFLDLGPAPKTIAIAPDQGAPGDGSPLTVVFEVIPVSPAPLRAD